MNESSFKYMPLLTKIHKSNKKKTYSVKKTYLVILRGNITARRYIDDVLQPHILPFLAQQGHYIIFQQDNAPAHRSFVTRDFLIAHVVEI